MPMRVPRTPMDERAVLRERTTSDQFGEYVGHPEQLQNRGEEAKNPKNRFRPPSGKKWITESSQGKKDAEREGVRSVNTSK